MLTTAFMNRNRKVTLLPTGLGMVRDIDPSTHPGMERWSFNVSGGGGGVV